MTNLSVTSFVKGIRQTQRIAAVVVAGALAGVSSLLLLPSPVMAATNPALVPAPPPGYSGAVVESASVPEAPLINLILPRPLPKGSMVDTVQSAMVARTVARTGAIPEMPCGWINGHYECGYFTYLTGLGWHTVSRDGYTARIDIKSLTWWQNGAVGCLVAVATTSLIAVFVTPAMPAFIGWLALNCTVSGGITAVLP